MAIQPDLKSENSRSIEAILDGLSPVLAEYSEALGVPVCLEVPRRRIARAGGDVGGHFTHSRCRDARVGWARGPTRVP